jgi:hypothetical protein
MHESRRDTVMATPEVPWDNASDLEIAEMILAAPHQYSEAAVLWARDLTRRSDSVSDDDEVAD